MGDTDQTKRPCLLLTGANGFLGEATLHQWGGRGKVYVLVRGRKGQTAAERFEPVAERIKSDGVDVECVVLSCDLSDEHLGLRGDELAKVLSEVTHVVNCAGNVRFDLTPSDAIENNVKTAVNVARFAALCKRIGEGEGRLVHVSTAYVSPPQPNGGLESPGVEAIKSGYPGTKEHHHNTYTWSKCIAEHCATDIANKSSISLSIIRPSMIGPAWASPYPGWCPGNSAPTQALGMLYGAGVLRVMQTDGALNIIPVDWVAKMTIDALFRADAKNFYTATVPPTHMFPVRDSVKKYCSNEIFNSHPSSQYRAMKFIFADGLLARALELILEDSHAVVLRMIGQKKASKLVTRALNARDLASKPYGSEIWYFDPDTDLELWPQDVSYFAETYYKLCVDTAAATLRKLAKAKGSKSSPRMGNYVDVVVLSSLISFIVGIFYIMTHGISVVDVSSLLA